jgi:hypothetical protein
MTKIITITDHNLDAFIQSERMALVLARSNCNRCILYQSEIRQLLDEGALSGTTVGILMLDQPGTSQFKRDNLWLMSVDLLPYTLLYRRGQRVDGFAGGQGHVLLDRARRLPAPELMLAYAE